MCRGLLAVLVTLSACGRIGFDPSGDGLTETNLAARPIITAGDGFACVRRSDGSVWCWGEGRSGALGNGGEDPRITPAAVAALPPVIAIDAGTHHVCALDESGAVWCWGDNSYGKVNGGASSGTLLPTQVALPRAAVSVSASRYHSCAVLDDASLACWGKNNHGQLGNGVVLETGGMALNVLDKVTSVATGTYHTCAVRDGVVWCWGDNGYAQIGDGVPGDHPVPTELVGVTATSVTAGEWFSCALVDGGRFRCWGDNGDYQLGDTGDHPMPAPVSSFGNIVALRAGGYHVCAVRADESIWCWGDNTFGMLGDGAATGGGTRFEAPRQPTWTDTFADVAAGYQQSCGVTAAGEVRCWGVGRFGVLGDTQRMVQTRPQIVNVPAPPVFLSVGARSACAIVGATDRALYCWGSNSAGQLGLPAGGIVLSPTDTGIRNVGTFSMGEDHMCATIAGVLNCWGANYAGQLGDGTTRLHPLV